MANVFSIAALVTSWRMCLVPSVSTPADAAICIYSGGDLVLDQAGFHYPDPRWCYYMNVASLVVGFVGNIFLLFNFTNRVRYIIALPVTIIMWYFATGILIGITVCVNVYQAPIHPQQTYSQGFWYAIIAACMYLICSMLLMVNMLGYFLGHYPQTFTLTDSQRTLILQTMLFFLWLAGGAAVFDQVESKYGDPELNGTWTYVNALYFSDVTILTVGFGDLYPVSNLGRGLVFPYSVGGIIILGLMVSSISKFATELGSEKIIRRHVENSRARTIGRTVTTSLELERRRGTIAEDIRPTISSPILRSETSIHQRRTINFGDPALPAATNQPLPSAPSKANVLRRVTSLVPGPTRRRTRTPRLLLLREEKDRFDAMRRIQRGTTRFKRWYALAMSITAFGLLWCVGAVVFWRAEQRVQPGITYFQALYFCYVSLLTIGYGDLAPKSNAGRPFFVFWSLIAVPTMTILVSDLGDTVISKFKRGTFRVADFTVLPQKGVWASLLRVAGEQSHLVAILRRRAARKRVEKGFPVPGHDPAGDPIDELDPTLEEIAAEIDEDEHTADPGQDFAELARRLPHAIRRTARDLKTHPSKKYDYEQWVEYTRLIRFTASSKPRCDGEKDEEGNEDEEIHGMVEWDWIGENSPMMAKAGEPEFVLERLLESMSRYIRQTSRSRQNGGGGGEQAQNGFGETKNGMNTTV